MKIREGESYEDWCNRVQMYEHGNAMMQIAQGKDIDQVMEQMSRRIVDKLMHPLYKEIKNSIVNTYDVEQCKQHYYDSFLKNRKPIADHVDGNTFDNT